VAGDILSSWRHFNLTKIQKPDHYKMWTITGINKNSESTDRSAVLLEQIKEIS